MNTISLEIEIFEILLPLALILFLSKLLGLTSKKIGLPAVVGMLVTGILIGLVQFIPGVEKGADGVGGFIYTAFFCDEAKLIYKALSKIGVVLIMFSVGLGTDIRQIKSTGLASVVITSLGVIVPMALGFLVAFLFDGLTDIALLPGEVGQKGFDSVNILSDLFYGAILTATSVSITVATLKELGKTNSKVGTAIISAAVIDDIIGIILLSVLTGFNPNKDSSAIVSWNNPNVGLVILKIFLFFVFAMGFGYPVRRFFRKVSAHSHHTRRLPIFAISLAFLYAYIAEKVFGVAEITGAYFAGIVLCQMTDTSYEEEKADSLGYLIFSPVFFANIGISSFTFDAFGGTWLAFGFTYVLIGLLGKFLGCSAGGLLTKFNKSDSAKIGLGMMVRAEVILVCAQAGENAGLVSPNVVTYVCLLIIVSSLLAPTLIKKIYQRDEKLLETPIEAQV